VLQGLAAQKVAVERTGAEIDGRLAVSGLDAKKKLQEGVKYDLIWTRRAKDRIVVAPVCLTEARPKIKTESRRSSSAERSEK
jgi:hypothetical protein